jgi:hypothetical protein
MKSPPPVVLGAGDWLRRNALWWLKRALAVKNGLAFFPVIEGYCIEKQSLLDRSPNELLSRHELVLIELSKNHISIAWSKVGQGSILQRYPTQRTRLFFFTINHRIFPLSKIEATVILQLNFFARKEERPITGTLVFLQTFAYPAAKGRELNLLLLPDRTRLSHFF